MKPGPVSRNPFPTVGAIDSALAEHGGAIGLAEHLGASPPTVRRWRRFLLAGDAMASAFTTLPNSEPWGGDTAPVLGPLRPDRDEVVLIASDPHVPYHDRAIVGAMLALAADLSPDRVVLNGDTADYFGISRHNKTSERLDSLQAEVDAANAYRAAWRTAVPDAELLETEGNHDARLRAFVREQARALSSLRALDPANLSAWEANAIRPFSRAGVRLRADFLVKHGDRVRAMTGATARAELAASGVSGASGHTHRLGQAVGRSGYGPRLEWWEAGCLCQLAPDYIDGAPDWRHGGLVVTFAPSGAFAVEPIQAWGDGLRFGGRAYVAP